MVDGPLVGAGAGGRAQHHAISLRKVGVSIGVHGSNVTYQKHLCPSQHFPGSKNDPECTALYSGYRTPDGRFGHQRLSDSKTQTHSSLSQHTWPLSKVFSRSFFHFLEMNLSVCLHRRGGDGGEFIRPADLYNSAKEKKKRRRISSAFTMNQ